MTKKNLFVVAAVLCVAFGAGCQDNSLPTDPAPTRSEFSKHNPDGTTPYEGYIVVLKDNLSDDAADAATSDLWHKHNASLKKVFKRGIKGFAARLTDKQADELAGDSRIKYIEPDYEVSVAPSKKVVADGKTRKSSNSTTTTTTSGQKTPWGVTKVGGSHDGTGKTAWIIDTGIDLANADLNVDVTRSQNFVADGQTATDVYGHGTHVAGIIGAKNNTFGVVGVAANATLVSVRVLGNNGSGFYSDIIAGINYVAANGHAGDVVNMSLGGGASDAMDDAIRSAADRGIIFAIAAGNNAINANNTSPARVEYPGVYVVSAIDQNNIFASFSNYGNPPIDFAAPGVNIESTRLGGGTVLMSGTSMAAPHVAGLLLLGSIRGSGTASSDPDGYADPIAHY